MTWYSASIALICEVSGEPDGEEMFEESIRLVEASSEADASAKANSLGKECEHEYLNDENELVRWRFDRVTEIQEIDAISLKHGTEVFSRLRRRQGDTG